MKRPIRAIAASLAYTILWAAWPAWATPADGQDTVPGETNAIDALLTQQAPVLAPDAASVTATCDRAMALIAERRDELEAETGPATFDRTFRRYDDLTLLILSTTLDATLVANVHTDSLARDAGQACAQKAAEATTALSLSQPVYARLAAIDAAGAGKLETFLLVRALRNYRAAGVDRDAATRAQITRLQEQITAAGLAFQRNINDGRLEITARPDELVGLPQDFIDNHPAGKDGLVRISTDYPDLTPVMTYATDEALRRRLFETNYNRAPENAVVLKELLERRYELARLLGHADFAHHVIAGKMIGSPENVRAFLGQLDAVTAEPARRDYARMAERLGTEDVPAWSTAHVQQLLRREDYAVDPQDVRRYFAYDNVRDGIFRLTEDLFGVQIRPWDTQVWAPGVQAYEMLDDGAVIGRFYLDNHPRDGKYNHAMVSPLRIGVAGRVLPVAALVCNFPAGDHATGLMEHRDVETFLHEFGHLLHVMFSGDHNTWVLASVMELEWDFVEAPSQMLENWVWDYETLRRFAVDADGNPIPADLVARMNRSRGFAEAFGDRRDMGLAAVSLDLYTGAPPSDIPGTTRASYNRYSLSPMPENTRFENIFSHLDGYSAIYYTYLWSKTISTDLFTTFEAGGLRNMDTARSYRERILAQGSSKPAGALVEDFLGRPFNLDAYRKRLGDARAAKQP